MPPPRVSQAFTLVELLITVALIGLLTSMLLPAIAKAKAKAHAIVCAANMKSWACATQLYADDFKDSLPPFGDLSSDYTQPFWHAKLAPYLSRKATSNTYFTNNTIFRDATRRCPAGRSGSTRSSTASTNLNTWNSWIGAHFGFIGQPLSGAFYYADKAPPVRISRIGKPSDAMSYMDTLTHYVYSPAEDRYRFTLDFDQDGAADSAMLHEEGPYNSARPTVHNNGANVTLLDGHVERVRFKSLWKIDSSARAAHSFWYLED